MSIINIYILCYLSDFLFPHISVMLQQPSALFLIKKRQRTRQKNACKIRKSADYTAHLLPKLPFKKSILLYPFICNQFFMALQGQYSPSPLKYLYSFFTVSLWNTPKKGRSLSPKFRWLHIAQPREKE